MLDLVNINYGAIFTAVLSSFIVGWVWYSPALCGKAWQKAIAKTDAELKKGMLPGFVTWGVSAIITAFVLDNILVWVDATSMFGGVLVAFWLWLGFVITTLAVNNKFAHRPPILLWIDGGHQLLTMLVMGAVLAVWL